MFKFKVKTVTAAPPLTLIRSRPGSKTKLTLVTTTGSPQCVFFPFSGTWPQLFTLPPHADPQPGTELTGGYRKEIDALCKYEHLYQRTAAWYLHSGLFSTPTPTFLSPGLKFFCTHVATSAFKLARNVCVNLPFKRSGAKIKISVRYLWSI